MNLKDASLLKSRCLVNGEWIGNPEIVVENPSTNEAIGSVPRLGGADARLAIKHAQTAFPHWSRMTAKERGKIIRRWYELMIENKDDLALILTSEQGKPLAEAAGEIDYAANFLEFFAEEAKRVYGETIPSHKANARIVVTKQPVGVVAAITPWNFPAAMITRKVGAALAVGCTVVCKPATETPLTALALAELGQRAGIPAGVLNVITGKSFEIGEELTSNPAVRAVTFTGSTEVGKILMRQCASTIKKVALELGGNAPFIVFDDADLHAAVKGAVEAKFRNTGQTCVCANRILVQSGVYSVFIELLAKEVAKLKVGDGTGRGVVQGPLINAAAVRKVEEHIKDAVELGAEIVVGGERHELGGNFIQPTVLKNVTTSMLLTREETFGPLAPVCKFETEEEAVALANDTPSGLAAYLYSRDIGRCWRVAEALEVGMVGVNEGLLATELAPFGGVKESGLGREGSHYGIEEFVEAKYMLVGGLGIPTA
ncbi:NAD-dependent succinate-semialdehyde dehydrogenase [Mesorhizobium ventifaucium]|uniref:NADP(+)-dependent succinate-semialdehyde dehydrogenase n=1 Tax=Mesorhizobium ventifaucium TaxID=666020 RepID=A0ABM9DIZ8_9HYPH|nr:NAD-dependent succinate-semialdehyde dehydrogenase [Mesorhizobium ventifaucium]CAH2396549.1 NADP(+)-dependent succinate-semialdehyde dehydrogenase [Mesorhizobium ventifaucium]